jgi:hypothetical protein
MTDNPDADWHENEGVCPRRFVGTERRVFVELRGNANGRIRPAESWRAHGGRYGQSTRWTLEGMAGDILRWREA